MENNNALMCLNLYKLGNTWAFDDDKNSIVAEPFVLGMSEIITHHIPDSNNCQAIFGMSEFPGCETLELLKEEYNGGWYVNNRINMSGWLCPVTRVYLNQIPDKIYYTVK